MNSKNKAKLNKKKKIDFLILCEREMLLNTRINCNNVYKKFTPNVSRYTHRITVLTKSASI